MGRTGRVDPGHVFACVFAIVAHLFFWWMLTRKIVLPAGETSGALQVTWIEPSLPSPPPATAANRPDAARPTAPRRPAPSTPPPTHVEAQDTPPSPGSAPMSAVFIEQGRQLSRAAIDADADAFVADPLAHRAAKLPGAGDDGFRMSNPPSIRGTLLKIGAVFGGPGYTTDPCQRVASNIGELSQLGDSALLQEELRRKRALCD